jgi:hypothetical protein
MTDSQARVAVLATVKKRREASTKAIFSAFMHASDLIPLQPLPLPSGLVFYMDIVYGPKSKVRRRT